MGYLDVLYLEPDLVIRPNLAPELRLFHGSEEEEFVTDRAEFTDPGAAALSHRLHQDDTGNHGVIREVTLEERLGVGKGAIADDPFLAHNLQTVNKEEWFAMGKKFLDFCHRSLRLSQ